MGTSNPGRVSLSPGGVARNVAEVLARLGVSVRLIGAFGDDPLSRWVRQRTENAGVVVHEVPKSDLVMGTYISIQDDGDMATAFSDLRATEAISPVEVVAVLDGDPPPHLIVIDCNLATATMQSVILWANKRSIPVVVEPVSATKAARVHALTGEIACITPNIDEARALGLEWTDNRWRWSADRTIPRATIAHWCVTRGAEGASYCSGAIAGDVLSGGANGEGSRPGVTRGDALSGGAIVPALPVEVVNTNGAGDAFVAGVVWALSREELFPPSDWSSILRVGVAAAGCAVRSRATTPPSITAAYLHRVFDSRRGDRASMDHAEE